MNASSEFRELLACSWPADQWRDVTVLVAVSGGADSVALLRGLAELKTSGCGRLVAAHYNHCLRGDASDADQAFVADLCAKLNVPLVIGRAEAPLHSAGDGIEAAARAARYAFLSQAADRWGARYIVTAHTADDQVETILLRILRGTGIGGLAGIPRVRSTAGSATVLRPLLQVRRSQLLAYLNELGQPFCEDASNRDPGFARNKLRHLLLPLVAREFNPRVDEALLRLGQLAGEAQGLIDQRLEPLWQHVNVESPAEVRIHCRDLPGQNGYLLRELFISIWKRQQWPQQGMALETWQNLAELAPASSGKLNLPGAICAEKQGEWLVLTRPVEAAS